MILWLLEKLIQWSVIYGIEIHRWIVRSFWNQSFASLDHFYLFWDLRTMGDLHERKMDRSSYLY